MAFGLGVGVGALVGGGAVGATVGCAGAVVGAAGGAEVGGTGVAGVAQAESTNATTTMLTRKRADVFIVSSPYYESNLIRCQTLCHLVVLIYSEFPPFLRLVLQG